MSGVLHPVGPEEPRTYWVRRAGVIAAVLIVLALIIALAVNASGGERQATPMASPSTKAPQPSTSPTAGTAPTSTSPTPTSSATTTSPTPSPTKSSASPSPTKTATPECKPKDVRTTLTGKQKFKAKDDLTFNLSVINGGAQSCVVDVNPKTFELKIYSGADRIWSTNDCATLVKPIKKTIGAEKSVEWKIVWDGKRSVKECKSRPEVPKPGTYIATAHLDGAKPVKLGMTLTS